MKLSEWTEEKLLTLLSQNFKENRNIEFKEMLPNNKDDKGKFRLAKSVAAFANTWGGQIIFGVKDDVNLPPQERIVGVPGLDFRENFGNYPSKLEPSFDKWIVQNPAIELKTGKAVYVVEIQRSIKGPHGVLENGFFLFCKRTEKGVQAMTVQDIRDRVLRSESVISGLCAFKNELNTIKLIASNLMKSSILVPFDTNYFSKFPVVFSAEEILRRDFGLIGKKASLISKLKMYTQKSNELLNYLSGKSIRGLRASAQSELFILEHDLNVWCKSIIEMSDELNSFLEDILKQIS